MLPLTYLLFLLSLYIDGSPAEITVTQSPGSISVSPGEDIIISCRVSESIYLDQWKVDGLGWTQHRPGQPRRGLIYDAVRRLSGIPEKYVGSGSGREFTFTIKGAGEDDVGEYYCHQFKSFPYNFGGGTTVEIKRRENAKPSVFIFRPSVEQITSGSASSVCFVDQFYPGDAKVTWKADNKVITSGVETSDKIKDKDSTYSLSSTLTMPSAEFKKYETFTCEVTHVTLTPALATSFKASECTF